MPTKRELEEQEIGGQKKSRTDSQDKMEDRASRLLIETLQAQIQELKEAVEVERARGEKDKDGLRNEMKETVEAERARGEKDKDELRKEMKEAVEAERARGEKSLKEHADQVEAERLRGEKALKEEKDRQERREERVNNVIKGMWNKGCETMKYVADNAAITNREARLVLRQANNTITDKQHAIVYGCQARIKYDQEAKNFFSGNVRDVKRDRELPTEEIIARKKPRVAHITKFKSLND